MLLFVAKPKRVRVRTWSVTVVTFDCQSCYIALDCQSPNMDFSLALYHTKTKLKFDLESLIDLWNSLEFNDPMQCLGLVVPLAIYLLKLVLNLKLAPLIMSWWEITGLTPPSPASYWWGGQQGVWCRSGVNRRGTQETNFFRSLSYRVSQENVLIEQNHNQNWVLWG